MIKYAQTRTELVRENTAETAMKVVSCSVTDVRGLELIDLDVYCIVANRPCLISQTTISCLPLVGHSIGK